MRLTAFNYISKFVPLKEIPDTYRNIQALVDKKIMQTNQTHCQWLPMFFFLFISFSSFQMHLRISIGGFVRPLTCPDGSSHCQPPAVGLICLHYFFVNQCLNIPVSIWNFFQRNKVGYVIECRLPHRFSPCGSMRPACQRLNSDMQISLNG